ncbi:MAG: LysM peptidoglycan-binding domain-containing protein [Chloroflexi bacterium]|nr:LysM peptidoglycan-binding domain-containing protein [Chloroflexota bacterium]
MAAASPLSPVAAAGLAAPVGAEPVLVVPGNLLTNPGFESPFVKQCCQTDLTIYLSNTPIDEVQAAHGWSGWWRQPDSSPDYPSRCDLPTSERVCEIWHRPEWREAAPYASRIHTGLNAQKYFTFWSVHESGMYQRVTGLTPGTKLQFSAYMSAWSTAQAENLLSAGQQSMTLKVGIDPYGGTNPFSSNIVWSQPGDSYDTFAQFTVQATAGADAVTVFTYSRPVYPLQHNDVYVDDAALVALGKTAAPSVNLSVASPRSQPAPVAAPGSTTVDPATGNILYVVQPRDTLWSISQRFNTTTGALASLNGLKDPYKIKPGKVLIVGRQVAPKKVYVTTKDANGNLLYTVQTRDTLYTLAGIFNTTTDALMQLNGLKDAAAIRVGQVIIVGKAK